MNRILIAAALIASATAANATNIITNGDFETGTLAGWTNAGDGYGYNAFYEVVNNGGATPISGHTKPVNANGGGYFAISDQNSAGNEILIQSFTIAGASQTLSFDWYDNNTTSFTNDGALNYNTSQTMRVDILGSGAGATDTGTGVVQNLLLNQTSSGWTTSLFNLNLAAGTYQLRFASNECCSFQEFGIDNVVLNDATAVPEPAMLGLFGLGAIGLGLSRRRKAA